MNFKEYLNESNEMDLHLQALMFLLENENMLNESTEALDEAFDKHLNKLGLKLHKSKGIIDYIKGFSRGVGKIIFYLIKGDTEKAKELLKTVKKEDILDFLYKLDLGTLHLVTGPIHMIDAWFGYDLSVRMKEHMDKGEGLTDILKQSLEKLSSSIKQLFHGTKEKSLMKHVEKIKRAALVAEA